MTALGYNPRWVHYARMQGRNAEQQLAHDRKAWPGGSMCGFILWGREQLPKFSKAHPEAFMVGGHLIDHAAYDNWLAHQEHDCVATGCTHLSSCAFHNPPALPAGPCDCRTDAPAPV